MSIVGYGIQASGFVIKRLPEILAENASLWQSAFGATARTDPASVGGQIIGVFSKKEAELWEELLDLYSQQSILSAYGVGLDNTASIGNVTRLVAAASTVVASMRTTNIAGIPVSIPAGTKVSPTSNAGLVCTLDALTPITNTAAVDCIVQIVRRSSTPTYEVDINSNGYSYTAGGTDTIQVVAAALVTRINAGETTITAVDNLDGTFSIAADDSQTAFSVTVTCSDATAIVLYQVGSLGSFTATTTGLNQIDAGTFTQIVTPVSGLSSVYNAIAGIPGRAAETDVELRLRYRTSGRTSGSATAMGIRSRILQQVTGVSLCEVYENDTDVVTVDGLPAHSYEVVVQGGDNQTIANVIWATKPGGIQTWSPVSTGVHMQVTDAAGHLQVVNFARPLPKYIWVKARYTVSSEIPFPTNGASMIAAAILAYGDMFVPGQDVVHDALYGTIFTVQGLAGVPTLQIAVTDNPTDSPSYGTANISITPQQIAEFSTTRMDIASA